MIPEIKAQLEAIANQVIEMTKEDDAPADSYTSMVGNMFTEILVEKLNLNDNEAEDFRNYVAYGEG